MILRILLSIAMLLPALPTVADCGDCPFTSVEECREWLDACCGAGDDVEAICGLACIENRCDETEACGAVSCAAEGQSECSSTVSCCSAESEEPDAAGCSSEPTYSSDDLPCGDAAESSAIDGVPVCLWCVCCPMGRPRPPEPQPAPITQRASEEKEKPNSDSGSRRFEPPVMSTLLLAFARVDPLVFPDSRQAMLCVWRN